MPLRFPKPYADFVARLRVPCGFLFLAAFLWFAQPAWWSLAAGLPVAVAGMALRAWAAGHLAKNQRLARGGPYAHVRNPLYLGSLVVTAGVVLAARHIGLAAFFAAAFIFIYLPVIGLEEQHLRKLFPEYEDYARRVPMLWPRGKRVEDGTRFRPELYWKNQEYKALAGFACAAAWLAWLAAR